MMQFSKQWLSALFIACAGCSSAAPQPESATTQEALGASVDGVFERYLVTPRGDVDGILLQDGTIARFAPHLLVASGGAQLKPGDAVHLEGEVVVGPAGRVVGHAVVRKGTTAITLSDQSSPPPPPHPAPAAPGTGPADDLPRLTASGAVTHLLADPRGRIEGFILVDGTTVRAGRRARLGELGLKVGDNVTVTGPGGVYPSGKAIHLETITLPGGNSRTLERPRAERVPATRDGVVSRLLINPHGDLDGVVLASNDVVRFPPTSASVLAVGSQVHATGVASSRVLRADSIRLGTGQDLQLEPPQPPSPSPLSQVSDNSIIDQVLPNLEGEAEMLVLRDGAIVRIPPEIRDDATQWLVPGAAVQAAGEGGIYAGVKALHAQSLTIGGRQFTADPRPAPLPPAAPALLP